MKIIEEKWSPTGNRVDVEVKISRLFKASYFFKTHIVGENLKDHDLEGMLEKIVEMIDNESFKISKRGSRIFPMRASFNATGYIYEKNFPSDESE